MTSSTANLVKAATGNEAQRGHTQISWVKVTDFR